MRPYLKARPASLYNCGPALLRMHLPRIIRVAALLALPSLAQAVDFDTEVHPILAARCAPCHGGAKPAAGLSGARPALGLPGGASGPAIVPGNSGASLLIEKVSGQRGGIMPASGEPLTAAQISTLRAWIDAGAGGQETPPRKPGGGAPSRPGPPLSPGGGGKLPLGWFLRAFFG